MWQAEFLVDEGEEGECLPVLSGRRRAGRLDDDYDEIDMAGAWLEENTLARVG